MMVSFNLINPYLMNTNTRFVRLTLLALVLLHTTACNQYTAPLSAQSSGEFTECEENSEGFIENELIIEGISGEIRLPRCEDPVRMTESLVQCIKALEEEYPEEVGGAVACVDEAIRLARSSPIAAAAVIDQLLKLACDLGSEELSNKVFSSIICKTADLVGKHLNLRPAFMVKVLCDSDSSIAYKLCSREHDKALKAVCHVAKIQPEGTLCFLNERLRMENDQAYAMLYSNILVELAHHEKSFFAERVRKMLEGAVHSSCFYTRISAEGALERINQSTVRVH